MAVAGLHNVPDFARSFFGESQKRDSGGRWDEEHCRRSTRASALLQMWREIEGEHVLSQSYRSRQHRNGSDSSCRSTSTSIGDGSENGDAFSQVSDESENQGFSGSEPEHEDFNSVISEQSSDLGETERERVRQIFQEWMNSCPKGHPPYGLNGKDRSGHCLGDIETQRIRILRERAQSTAQRSIECASPREGVADVGFQTMQARDGLVNNRPEIGARRPLRRLCGRQTLLDLLLKAQNERKRELQSLSENRPVSDFAHRNRIQALLRGRFLRNGGMAVDERPCSVAATELGVLRQRQTVSDLREGFLSKLDSFGSASVNDTRSDSSYSDGDGNNCESESTCIEGRGTRNHITADMEDTNVDGNRNMEELEAQIVEAEEPVLLNEGSREDVPVCAEIATSFEESALATQGRQHGVSANINCSGSSEVHNENNESISGVNSVHEVDDHITDLEGNTNEEFDSHDASIRAEESQDFLTENEESAEQNVNTFASTEWVDDGTGQDMNRFWQERAFSQSFPEPSVNNVEDQDQMQESHDWPSHDLQEAIDSWLDMPSSEAGEPVREVETVYFPYDDDNGNSMELRELFSRRCVSSLLHSSFRQTLDQVLQSHAERLGHSSDDLDLDISSVPPLIEQDHEELTGDQSPARSESAERNPFTQSSTNFEASQLLWNEDFQGTDWAHHYPDHQLETEWDVINELRIDMARLQERMNDMQGMLETCMDMQLELQRSLHQEVSAALNRSNSSMDVFNNNGVDDESRWDRVKIGICCLCQQSKIDSLLYRCGHMCTCTNCAENLVQSNGKCPMCCAPVVEAVRAYFVV